MHEIDFLPVESDGESGSKCGDAIAIRFTCESVGRDVVVVIDGGYGQTGENLVEHIGRYYGTSIIDLVVSTHPDADHLNGLVAILEQADVRQLMVHRPRNHASSLVDFSNIEALDKLITTAEGYGVPIVEPFQGVQAFGGQLTVLGPSEDYYVELLNQYLEEERTGKAAERRSSGSSVWNTVGRKFEKILSWVPIETLSNDVETGPRNNMSVITLLAVDGRRLLFTGDAGIPALESAADYLEFGRAETIAFNPLSFFQVPHHGSRRNVGPDILDRWLGAPGAPHGDSATAFISSAKACKDHPSPKVTNAVVRRGGEIFASEGRTIHHQHNAPARPGWTALAPLEYVDESD